MSIFRSHYNGASRKESIETMMAQKRAKNQENLMKWENHSNYLNKSAVRAAKEKNWTSNKCYENSMQAFDVQVNEREENNETKYRKNKLSNLLESERQQQKTMLEAVADQSKDTSYMLMRSTALKQSRDRDRAQLAEKLLIDHFRMNNKDLKEISRTIDQDDMIRTWEQQVEEKKEQNTQEEMQRALDHEKLREAQRVQAEEDAECGMRRLKLREDHLEQLQYQLEELRYREEEAKHLAEKEDALTHHLVQLETLAKERQVIEEKCKREVHGRALLRQHQAALRRRSAVVQSELQADLEWLARVGNQEAEQQYEVADRKRKEKESIREMKEMIERDLERERKQEIELDALQSQEAARLWNRREEEWRKETDARNELLQEVLKERRNQVVQNLINVRRQQREELESREQLLIELEQTQKDDKRQAVKQKERVDTNRRDLESQIDEKRSAGVRANKQAEVEQAINAEAEAAYEVMLRREAEKMEHEPRLGSVRTTRTNRLNILNGPNKSGGNIW